MAHSYQNKSHGSPLIEYICLFYFEVQTSAAHIQRSYDVFGDL